MLPPNMADREMTEFLHRTSLSLIHISLALIAAEGRGGAGIERRRQQIAAHSPRRTMALKTRQQEQRRHGAEQRRCV